MIVTIPKILTEKLGSDGADALARLMNDADAEKDVVTKGDFKAGLAETKSDLLKWMFLFWIGQVAATLTIFSFLLKK